MILRAARPEDADALALILGDWVREAGWMPVLHTREEDRGFLARLVATASVTVAEEGGALSGFLAREGEEVGALYLAPLARGRGVGRALLDAAKAEGRLRLWTFEANEGARAFYAREGFREVRRTDGDNDEGLPDLLLEWSAS